MDIDQKESKEERNSDTQTQNKKQQKVDKSVNNEVTWGNSRSQDSKYVPGWGPEREP